MNRNMIQSSLTYYTLSVTSRLSIISIFFLNGRCLIYLDIIAIFMYNHQLITVIDIQKYHMQHILFAYSSAHIDQYNIVFVILLWQDARCECSCPSALTPTVAACSFPALHHAVLMSCTRQAMVERLEERELT